MLLMLLLACPPVLVPGSGDADGGALDGGALDGGALDGGALDGGALDGGALDGGGGDGGDGGGGDGGAVELPTLTLELDPDVVTMIHASWEVDEAVDPWVEYRFEGEDWQAAPAIEPGAAVILGVPAETAVEARLAAAQGDTTATGEGAAITTGSLPRDMPLPTVELWDEALAEPARFAMISVSAGDSTYQPPYWIQIFDRQGRVVWYHEVADQMITFYASVARDGTHIWYDAANFFGLGLASPSLVRRTLDGRWSHEVATPGMGQASGEGPDGTFYYELRSSSGNGVNQVDAEGNVQQIWDCDAWMRERRLAEYYCYMNATNWSELHDSVLASMFYIDTVFEIDLATGQPIRQMGQLTAGEPWSFSPPESVFDYQHWVHWLDEDTLLASTHLQGRSGIQIAAEYHVDDETQTLTRGWYYQSNDLWATQVGEAVRLPGGNTVQGYGQDGAVREVTTDHEIAWQVSWEPDRSGYRVIGHLSLFDDIYALNQGPE